MKKCFFPLLLVCCLSTMSVRGESVESHSNKVVAYEEQEMFDEFDSLVDDAISRGVLKKKIEFKKPTRLKLMLAKMGMPLIRFYSYIVLKYRAFAKWLAVWWYGKKTS